MHLPPGAEKKLLGVIYRENLYKCAPSTPSAPSGRTRVNFKAFLLGGEDLEVGAVHLVDLDRLLRATTKKVNFFEEKSAPSDKIICYYDVYGLIISRHGQQGATPSLFVAAP